MNPCDGPFWECVDGGTKPQLQSYAKDVSLQHNTDRLFVLTSGSVAIDISKRERTYAYTQRDRLNNTDGKVVAVSASGEVAYIDCATQTTSYNAFITENYKTTDVTFFYADLRSDTFVYEESVQVMAFSASQSTRVPLKTSFDDAYLYPFIKEEVPIIKTNRIISTDFATPLFEEVVNSGYWNGIRILMPLFNSGDPRKGFKFTIDGVEYDAGEVDWYYIDLPRRESDGDEYFWWADWHKAVGMNLGLDEAARDGIYSSVYSGVGDQEKVSVNGVVAQDFTGSNARDVEGSVFFSASFRDGVLLINKLKLSDDTEPEIPKEKISVLQDNGSYKQEDSQHTAYFPIAPI